MSEHVEAPFEIGRGFRHGFAAVKAAPWPLWLGGLIMSCTEGGGGSGGSRDGGGGDGATWQTMGGALPELPSLDGVSVVLVLVGLAVLAVIVLAICALRVWVHTGYLRTHEIALRTGAGDMGALFSGGDRFVPMALWKLLKSSILLGVVTLAAAPGGGALLYGALMEQDTVMILGGVTILLIALPALVYVWLGLALGEHALVFEELGPMDALDRSWSLARGRRVDLFLLLLIFGLFNVAAIIAGILMCCVGLLVTLPFAYSMGAVALSEGFLLLTRTPEETDAWAIWKLAS